MLGRFEKREAGAGDLEFLYQLYSKTLGPYLIQVHGPWNEDEERSRFFAKLEPSTHEVIELEGQRIACMFVQWLPREVKLNRVFVLPEQQGRWLGSRLVRDLI